MARSSLPKHAGIPETFRSPLRAIRIVGWAVVCLLGCEHLAAQTTLTATPNAMTYTAATSAAAPPAQTLNLSGTAGGSYLVTIEYLGSAAGWLSLNATQGTLPAALTVTANPTALTPGAYVALLAIDAGTDGVDIVSIVLNVGGTATGALAASPPVLSFSPASGGSASDSIAVNSGTAGGTPFTVSFATADGANWLTATAGGAVTPSSVAVSVNSIGLPAGIYLGIIGLDSTSVSGAVVPVILRVGGQNGGGGGLTLSPSTLSFSYTTGSATPAPQAVLVSNTAGAASYSATSSASWLLLTSDTQTTPAQTTAGTTGNNLLVWISPAGLAAGQYSGDVTVSVTGGGSQTVTVSLTVSGSGGSGGGSGLTVSPSTLSFSYTTGSATPNPQAVSVSNTAGAATYSASSSASWLLLTSNTQTTQAQTTTGTTGNNLLVWVSPSGLSAGQYSGTITVSVTGLASQSVTVSLTVSSSGGTSNGGFWIPVPSALSFSYTAGSAAPASQSVLVTNTSGGGSYSAMSSASWLRVASTTKTTAAQSTTGTAGSNLTISVAPDGLLEGLYAGVVVISGSGAAPQSVMVGLTVSGSTGGGGGGSLTLAPSALSFSYTAGSAAPASQAVLVSNSAGAASYTATTSTSWLRLTSNAQTTQAQTTTGTTGNNLLVWVSPTGLAAGQYSGVVTVSGTGAVSKSVTVSLTVSAAGSSGGAGLTVSPSALSFSYTAGSAAPAPQAVLVSNTSGAVTYTATTSTSWLQLTSNTQATPAKTTTGTTGSNLLVWLSPSSLAAGQYSGLVTVSRTGGNSQSVTVSLTVSGGSGSGSGSGSGLTLSPSTLSFSYTAGSAAPVPQGVLVSNTSGAVSYSAASSASWLLLTSDTQTAPAQTTTGTTGNNLLVWVSPSGLPAGPYSGTITVSGTGTGSQTVTVSLTVSGGSNGGSGLTLSQSTLSFSYTAGSAAPVPQAVFVSNSSSAASYSAASSASWLLLTSDTQTTPAQTITGTTGNNLLVWVSPSGLANGQYSGVITVSGTGAGSQTVTVSLTIGGGGGNSAGSGLTVSPSALSFSYTAGSAAPVPQAVFVSNTAGSAAYSASSSASWLLLTSDTQTTPAQTTTGTTGNNLLVWASPSGLADGQYSGVITVSGTGAGSQTVTVSLTVGGGSGSSSGSGLMLSPSTLSFSYTAGSATPSPQNVLVSNTSGAASYAAASSASWLLLTSDTQTTPAQATTGTTGNNLLVWISPSGLAAGQYSGVITVSGTGAGSQSVTVSLTVSGANSGGLTVTPSVLSFNAQAGGAAPAAQAITVGTSSGVAVLTASVSTANGGNWLSVSPTSGVAPGSLNVAVSVTGLAVGTYTGSVSITASGGGGARTVPVTLTVTGAGGGAGSGGAVTITSIFSSASWQSGPVAPGEMVSIKGSGLGPAAGVGAKILPAGAIDTAVAGTQVLFDAFPAPLLWVEAGQINAVVPYGIYGRTTTKLSVGVNGVQSNSLDLKVQDSVPAVFTVDGSGKGKAAVVNEDGVVNSPASPATRGSVVAIYATGEGQTAPPGQDGRMIITDLRSPILPVSVKIGGQVAPVLYAGSAPGAVSGLMQINVAVPLDIPPGGLVSLEVQVGSAASQSGITIAVK